jgi:hypothetical protein
VPGNPARADVTLDRVYGYNYHEVAKAAATTATPPGRSAAGTPTGCPGRGRRRRADDRAGHARADERIFEVISGHEFERIASAIWDLNDYGPQQRIANAGKASRAGSGQQVELARSTRNQPETTQPDGNRPHRDTSSSATAGAARPFPRRTGTRVG